METSFGFEHFLSHLDIVGRSVLCVLCLLSASSWTAALGKAWQTWKLSRQEGRALARWSLEVRAGVVGAGGSDPWARIARRGITSSELLSSADPDAALRLSSPEQLVATSLGRAVQEEVESLEKGLVLVATTSSAAPFVGLFGTVWSIYHALVAIGRTGEGGLDKVAGPVGEALVMTGIGLAVAIPALLLYNALGAWQRALGFRLEGFAQEVFAHLATRSARSVEQALGARRDVVAAGRT
jgi:biopolymer transport protein ExbB